MSQQSALKEPMNLVGLYGMRLSKFYGLKYAKPEQATHWAVYVVEYKPYGVAVEVLREHFETHEDAMKRAGELSAQYGSVIDAY